MADSIEETDVVVVGAGGGGAVLGLALAKQGIRTVVLDQAAGPPKGLRGEILQPNGQQVLDRLGVLPSLPADATRSVRHFHFCRAGGRRSTFSLSPSDGKRKHQTWRYGRGVQHWRKQILMGSGLCFFLFLPLVEKRKSKGLTPFK